VKFFEGLPKLRETLAFKNRLFQEAFEGASPEQKGEIRKEHIRWLLRNDLWFLAKATGHTLLVERFHRPLCEWTSFQNWQVVRYLNFTPSRGMPEPGEVLDPEDEAWEQVQRVWLLFRAAFKTTLITKLHTVQLLLNFPDLRIALTHFKQDIASQRLVSIKELFQQDLLKTYFPECVPQGKEWGTKTQVSLASRKPTTQDEASLTAIGVETTVTGAHFDLFKDDDIVTDKSVTTEEQIRQSADWLDRTISLFTNPTVRLRDTVGTRYHYADAYSKIKARPGIFLCEVPLLTGKNPVTSRGEVVGESILPERFPKRKIQDLINQLEGGQWEFQCQYLMNPSDPAQNHFHPDQIAVYEELPGRMNVVLTVDPASSRKKTSDYTVIKAFGIDEGGRWFILDAVRDRLDTFERIQAVCDMLERWGPLSQNRVKVLYEAIGFQHSDVDFFHRLRAERQLRCETVEIKAHTKRKGDRIRGLIPKYQRHEILWPKTLVRYSKTEGRNVDLIEAQRLEFLKFPLSEHDDLLDAESFLLMAEVLTPDAQVETKDISGTWKDAHNKLKRFQVLRGSPARDGMSDLEVWQEAYGEEALVGVSERYA